MKVASGIIFEKDRETQRRYLCVDLEQYGEELIPFLEKVGVILCSGINCAIKKLKF